jgi:hypothetical protein
MSQFFWPPINGISQSVIEAALAAVFPTNLLGSPKYHDAGTTNIGPAYVEVSGVGNGDIPAGTKKIQVSSIIGVPLNFGIGANAGAAVSMFNLVPGGGPVYFEYTFVAGAKLFVLTLDGSNVSGAGELFVVNFTG